jgi:hypothetical protein
MALPLVVSALVWCLAVLYLGRTEGFNALDEHTHFDYVVKIAEDHDLPSVNEQLGQTTLSTWGCDNAPAFAALECGAIEQDPKLAPWQGWSSATGYLPTYYVITGVGADLAQRMLGQSWLDSARLASSLWLALLAGMVVALARRLGATGSGAAASGIVIGSMPMLIVQGTSLNNDVAAAAVAVASVWLWLRLSNSTTLRRLVSTGALLLLALSAKETALVALVIVCLLELSHQHLKRGTGQPKKQPKKWLTVGLPALLGVSVLASYLILRVLDPILRGVLESTGPQLMKDALRAAKPPQWEVALADAYSNMDKSLQSPIPAPIATTWSQTIAMLVLITAIGGLAFAVSRTTWPWQESSSNVVRQATLIFIIAFPPVFMGAVWLQGWPVFFEPRYFLPSAVFAVLLLAPGATKAWSRAALVAAIGYFLLVATYLLSL